MMPLSALRPALRTLLPCLLFVACDANWGLNAAGKTEPQCGDGTCDPDDEDSSTCPSDCLIPKDCGNNRVDTGETCDDGPDNGMYGKCASDCSGILECGDDKVSSPAEKCDDGKDNGMQGKCKADCSGIVGCGDGVITGSEQCDDGLDNGKDKACTELCLNAFCGDGRVEKGMDFCDDGMDINNNNYAPAPHCNMDCTGLAPHCGDTTCDVGNENSASCPQDCACGDGKLDPGEDCDGGKKVDTPGCDADCTKVECGDMHANLEAGEPCDDGNMANDDACISCQTAICGDSFVQTGVEQCDDQNMVNDDTCSNDCQLPRRVFVTSLSYDGDLGGLEDADEKCQVHADIAELNSTFRAWLSDGLLGPADRFDIAFTGSYQLLNGTVVASDGWTDLADSSLAHAIDFSDKKVVTKKPVWTNTLPNGKPASMTDHCSDWQSTDSASTQGNSGLLDEKWTNDKGGQGCGNSAHLYCFENP